MKKKMKFLDFWRKLWKPPYYFPRKDFKIFTKHKLPPELNNVPRANNTLGYVNVLESNEGRHRLAFETWHLMGGDKIRQGDVWITTSKKDGRLLVLVFTEVNLYSNDFDTCSCDYTGTAQTFGEAGDLLQIERMKELVLQGGKFKPQLAG